MGAPFYAGAKAAFAYLASKEIAAQIIRTILINILLGALTRALSPNAAKQFAPPINVSIRSAIENRRLVFGTMRVGGAYVLYLSTSNGGDVSDPNSTNKYLFYVVALAGHQISALKTVYIDKIAIQSSDINNSTGVVSGSSFGTKIKIWYFLGTAGQAASSILLAAIPGGWPSTAKLQGVAYLVVRMERDDAAYPNGAPSDVTAVVDGALLYDPRLDSTNGGSGSHRYTDATTWAFSHNPILAARWFLTGGSVTNDVATPFVRYGLRELNSRIDDTYIIAAANHCDEVLTGAVQPPDGDQSRYACDLEVSTGEPRRDIIEAMMATCAGRSVYSQGKWKLSAGVYDSPSYAFTEQDLYGDIEIQDTSDHADRYNAVSAVVRNQAQQYTEQTTPYMVSSSYDIQDGGDRIPKSIDLRGIRNIYRGQRLCTIELRKSRQMRTIKIMGALNLMKVLPGETFTLSYARYGWVNRVFRCVDKNFDFQQDAGRVVITARSEASSVYTDMTTADYVLSNEVVPLVVVEAPDPPSNLLTVPQTNAILVKWTPSTTVNVTYELEQSTAYAMTSPTVIYSGADSQAVIDQTGTTVFYYRIRAKKNGVYSVYVPSSNGVAGAVAGVSTALAASVSPGSAAGSNSGTSQTTNACVVTPSGGTPGYTYAWTWFSGGGSITITSASAASTTFSVTGLTAGTTRTGVARCTVTDSAAGTKTVDVSVTITNGDALSVVASPTSIYKLKTTATSSASTVVSGTCTATAGGGTGSGYTYAWTWLSGGSGISIDSASSAATTFTGASMAIGQRTGVARCTATDSGSHTATVDVHVTLEHDTL